MEQTFSLVKVNKYLVRLHPVLVSEPLVEPPERVWRCGDRGGGAEGPQGGRRGRRRRVCWGGAAGPQGVHGARGLGKKKKN